MSMIEHIALVEKCAHRLAFYEALTGGFVSAIDLADYPHEMTRDPDGRTAYIGHYGALNSKDPAPGGSAIFVVDLIARRLVSTMDLRPWRRLHGLQCDAKGRLFVLSETEDVLLVIDRPKEEGVVSRAMRTGGIKGHLVTVTASGETAFCANLLSHTVTRLRPFEGSVAPVIVEPGPRPEGLCLSEDEARLLVLNRGDGTLAEIDAQTCRLRRVVALRGEATRIYRVGSQAFLLASYIDQSLSLLDAQTLGELAYLPLGGRVTAATLHPSRPEALASLENDRVVRIDLSAFTEIARFPTGSDPDVSTFVQASA